MHQGSTAGDSSTSAPLQDGRRIAFAEYGVSNGRPLVVLHGTPGNRTQARALDAAARRASIRIIAPDRPGCGYSDPRADLTFASYADDVRQLLDHLGVSRTAVAGISGGGAFALACAQLLPNRVSKAILVCGMAPVPAKWRKGTPLQNRLLFWLAAHWPSLAATLMQRAYVGDPSSPALRRTISMMPAADRRVLEREDARELLFGEASRDSLRQGPAAAIRELALFARPLDFSLRDIAVPVCVIHGDADMNVPLGVAQYLVAQIPGATLNVIPGAGHLFLFESPELLLERV
ncbi:MAG: alpha/beta fold hydrolase [Steroidobacteraceae bacterium]